MNAQSTSGHGHSLDQHTNYWNNTGGKGLPQMFWDWWQQNLETKFRVTYSNHAHKEHSIEFCGEYHPSARHKANLKSDKWIVNDFYVGDFSNRVFECHYDMTDISRPRKFIMSLPFYNKQNDLGDWHPVYNYTSIFASNNSDLNHLEVVSVWARKEGDRCDPSQRGKYANGVATPDRFRA